MIEDMECIFCKQPTKGTNKYCSTKCIKRASYLRKHPNTKSSLNHNPDFWKTETGIGYKWEKYIADLIGATHLEFNKDGADLDWKGKLVDVKSSHRYSRKHKRGKPVKKQFGNWVFNRNKSKPINWFFCVCLTNNEVERVYQIPPEAFANSGISIGKVSKFDIYRII
jgi:hypothetical protein